MESIDIHRCCCTKSTHIRGEKKQQLLFLHLVLIGAFLGFGVSSLSLGIYVSCKDSWLVHRDSTTHHRSKREADVAVQTVSNSIFPPSGDVRVFALSDENHVKDYTRIIASTWGESTPYQLLYGVERVLPAETHDEPKGLRSLDVGESYGYNHFLRSLLYACDYDRSQWYIFMPDNIYLNRPALDRALEFLSPHNPVLMGFTFPDNPVICDVSLGTIISYVAMGTICSQLELSINPSFSFLQSMPEPSQALGRFLFEVTGLSCSDALDVTLQFRAPSPNKDVSEQTVFIGPLPNSRSIQQSHALALDLEIRLIQEVIIRTQDEMTDDQTTNEVMATEDRDPRHKRESEWNQSDVPFQKASLRSTSNGEFISNDGQLFKDACKMTSYDLFTDDRSSFAAAHNLAKSVEDGFAMSFAYKNELKRKGIGYNFYSIDENKRQTKQVSISLSMSGLEVVKKTPIQFKDIHIVSVIPESYRYIKTFLNHIDSACSEYQEKTSYKCHLHLFIHHPFSLLHPRHGALEILEPYQQASGMDIKVSEHSEDPDFKSIISKLQFQGGRNKLHLFLPIDSIFDSTFLFRCVYNTKLRESVYFPVVLHAENNQILSEVINTETSFWMNKEFAVFSAYLSDILDFRASILDPKDVFSLCLWAGYDVHRIPDSNIRKDFRYLCRNKGISACMNELKLINFP